MPTNHAHVVITVHGIRTFGHWQLRLERLLRARDPEVEVRHLDYGWFSSLAYILPFTRWLAVRRVRRLIAFELSEARGARVDIVAHSFGTYLVGKALVSLAKSAAAFRVHTVILCGSVLSPWFDWSPLRRSPNSHVGRIVNDCGVNDLVLILGMLVPFSGMAGRIGFRGVQGRFLRNRYFALGHSGFFETKGEPNDFMERNWTSVLLSDHDVELHDVRKGILAGWQTLLLRSAEPVRLAAWGLLGVLAFYPLNRLNQKSASLALAAESEAALETGDFFSALLLAARASKLSSTLDAKHALLRALTHAPFAPRILAREDGSPKGFTRGDQLLALLQQRGSHLSNLLVFDLATGERSSLGLQAYAPFEDLLVSGNGSLALALSSDSTLRFWDLQHDRPALKNFDTKVAAAALDSDGQTLAVATPERISTYALGNDLIPLHSVEWESRWGRNWIRVAPGGRFVVVPSPFEKGIFAIIDMVTGNQQVYTSGMLGETREYAFALRPWWANAAAISDDGNLVMVGGCKAGLQDPCTEGYVAAIDVSSASVIELLNVEAPGGVFDIDLQPRGTAVAVTAGNAVIIWEPDLSRTPHGRSGDRTIVLRPRLPNQLFRGAAFDVTGRILAAGGWGEIIFWDMRRRNVIATPSRDSSFSYRANQLPGTDTIVRGPDGRFEFQIKSRVLRDVATQRERDTVPSTVGPDVFQFSPDGNLFASSGPRGLTGGPGGVRVVELTRDNEPYLLGAGTNTRVSALAFSPNGKLLAAGDLQGGIRLWDVAARRALGPRLELGLDEIWYLAFSSDGDTLISRSSKGALVNWTLDLDEWRRIACELTKNAAEPAIYSRSCS